MKTLSTEHRRQLERTVVNAREVAEAGARAALEALAVDARDPFDHMSEEQRELRRRLRAHARHLGDKTDRRSGTHGIDHLTHECAYEQWHAMLFARFLAENNLLIEPELGVPVTLDECEELAKDEGTDRWTLASRFAQRMLPQVFRPDHPVLQVRLARESRAPLAELVEGLPGETFKASDALGWVYQFWQARKKDEVNRSETKIGAEELPAVTQLFTEPYMVQFLLHNSLGAWWESRHPDEPCPTDLTYLRHAKEGQPAAGTFDGWPDDLSEFRLLDPCCGSGHFLVTALLMLVPMRMRLEGLDASTAVSAVLRDNLHGLEIDQRCVAIAAFALALEAWRYPDAGGFRRLPRFNLAWCGQPVTARREEWLSLAEDDSKLEAGMAGLHDAFQDAPTLGSLVEPLRSAPNDMLTAGFDQLRPLLERALRRQAGDAEREETAIAALGIAETAEILAARFHLVATNVPYLARRKQGESLRDFCNRRYDHAKGDLANVFLERCLQLVGDGGTVQLVMPQNWLFLKTYKAQRQRLLNEVVWKLLASLGPSAFETISGEVVNVTLVTLGRGTPNNKASINGIDARDARGTSAKVKTLLTGPVVTVSQLGHLGNPDARITMTRVVGLRLAQVADFGKGSTTGDAPRFLIPFWELGPSVCGRVKWLNSPTNSGANDGSVVWSGRSHFLKVPLADVELNRQFGCWLRGHRVQGRRGAVVNKMRGLAAFLYSGEVFDDNICPIVPRQEDSVRDIFCFVRSDEYHKRVREIDNALKVTASTLVDVPYNRERWEQVAKESYPNGLPEPYSSDPTQWIFHGHPCGSVVWDEATKRTAEGPLRTNDTVLQVAVARLLGYRWPAEWDLGMELADEQREWVGRCESLHTHEDEDGIVCVPSVRGERSGDERLLDLIRESYAESWTDDILSRLLEGRGTTINDWLRNRFFEEHCKLFHHRPFIWHVWDGRKRDGFHALVNYHRLAEGDGKGRRLLESLTYSYLGDWIARQRDGVARGEAGSDDRLAAAWELQRRLTAIIEGEPPFDLFVRWKPLGDQAIGWSPDLDDGVRLNIRPFLADDIPGGKKGAGVLRSKPNIHWRKDRGKEPLRDETDYPWFWADGRFTEERFNDRHFTNADKRAARGEAQ